MAEDKDDFDGLLDDKQPVLPGIIQTPEGAIPAVNERADAPTIYADAVQGAMLSPATVKITFLEHFLVEEGAIKGKYVLNLAFPAPQLRAIGDLFVRLADDMDAALSNGD